MNIRHPVRSGAFYESSPTSCRRHAEKLIDGVELQGDLPQTLYGGIVPHAGWMYSGKLAAKTFKALHEAAPLETVVLLGADHCGTVHQGEVYDSGVWRTPLGEVAVDEDVGKALLEVGDLMRANPQAHANEHSIEVQVPILQALAPAARIVPVAVPPTDQGVQIGEAIGKALSERFPTVRIVASTDLTHHAGHFPAPGGRGEKGVEWTRQNDRRMIDLMESMQAEQVIPESMERHNACGAGAIAAAIAATRAMGATRGILLEYTNSYEVIHQLYPHELDDTTVGYASLVFA